MTLTYDPRKLLKTGQGSRGSKLTLCGRSIKNVSVSLTRHWARIRQGVIVQQQQARSTVAVLNVAERTL
jgi:hypothetical protein